MPGEHPEDGEMNQIHDTALQTRDSRSSRPEDEHAIHILVTESPHNTEFLREGEKETFYFFETQIPDSGNEPQAPA